MKTKVARSWQVALVGVALVLTCLGCARGGVLLPASAGATLAFSPDERRLVIRQQDGSAWGYDVDRRAVLWRHATRGPGGVVFSSNGETLGLVERPSGTPTVRISVLRTSDGKLLLDRALPPGPPLHRVVGDILAISDDGRWLGIVDTERGQAELCSIDSGETVLQAEGNRIAFEPRGGRLATYHNRGGGPEQGVTLLSHEGGAWATAATIPAAGWPAWTAQGIGLMTPAGFGLWQGGAPRIFLADSKGIRDEIPRTWRFAPSAPYLATWGRASVTVHHSDDGRRVYFQEGTLGSSYVHDSAFHGHLFRAFLRTGVFIEIDLTTGRATRHKDFGSIADYSPPLFGTGQQGGGSWASHYRPQLSPSGRLIDIHDEDGHHLFRVEEIPRVGSG